MLQSYVHFEKYFQPDSPAGLGRRPTGAPRALDLSSGRRYALAAT
jgi:hypothetical protein